MKIVKDDDGDFWFSNISITEDWLEKETNEYLESMYGVFGEDADILIRKILRKRKLQKLKIN